MKFLKKALLSLLLTGFSKADDFPTLEIVGNKFFYSNNGSQFYIRGIAYQQNTANLTTDDSFVDPLIDESGCKRDIPYLTELNTNVIRVYALNSTGDHDACMSLLQDAGIYVIADLSAPEESIITDDPEWTTTLYDRYTSVIDMMQGYDNVLGFFAGNEVITNSTNSDSAPFVKAAIRDMKTYISDKGYRDIPVGYSANDDSDTRVPSVDYFNCGSDSINADFYGINMYEWCGNSTFKSSGYQARTEEFSNLTIPIFFSEYGCNAVQPRTFSEVGTLFSDEMTDVWSGGIVYMYFEEENNYGLVSLDGDSVSTLADFNYLKSEMQSISPTSATSSDIKSSAVTFSCPTENSDWNAATALPPTPETDVCECLASSSLCTVADDVSEDDYADLFSVLCNYVSCSDIDADGKTGEYGAYSYCNSKQKLIYLLNKYYEAQDSASSACDFSGSASVVSASSASTCKSVLSVASASASTTKNSTAKSTGTTKTSTGTKKTSSTSGSSSVSSISSTSKSSANGIEAPNHVAGISKFYMTTLVGSLTLCALSLIAF
ncbi:1,3-beta-glucanosyltransferase gas1 [Pichia californica]|uniref:1,3-beta-glucanosyltransferase n=1 Tax=Pichia californica TaxID=460514 RepID=A0A9P6WLK8_9ASCO|nr:1,3-beta-glucanosyltransferase gas1 [[Candida] californica]KAG0688372.1 1,3-beta-glucanosyltransferase gas1 [[Candida] californica]